MSKHTPGPLAMFEDAESIGIATSDERDWIIARMEVYASNDPDLNDDVQKANARLYAAAPDLLEACKAFLAGRDSGECWDLCQDAVAKAEGVSP